MTTKKKAPARNKEEISNDNTNSWPNLPQRLIKHIQKYPSLMQSINFGSVTKSWRSPTNKRHCKFSRQQTQPYWLCVSDGYDRNDIHPQYWSMSFCRDWYYKRWRRQDPSEHFWGCCHGHLLASPVTQTSKLYIVNPIRGSSRRHLPVFEDHVPFKCASLSSSPSDDYSTKSCVVMVVTGISCPAFLFYRLRGKPHSNEWTKQDCTLVDRHDNHIRSRKFDSKQPYMRFTNAIGFNEKFYALSSQGTLVVIEEVVDVSDDERRRFEVTGLGKTRVVPSLVPCKGFRECLIESNSEILLVFLVYGKTANVVDDVEVFRLCFDELSWIKVENLNGRTLFVGRDCCISVCAEKVGCRGNCVYFTQHGVVDGWWEYDLEVGQISPVWTAIGRSSSTKYLEWDEPIAEEDDQYYNNKAYFRRRRSIL